MLWEGGWEWTRLTKSIHISIEITCLSSLFSPRSSLLSPLSSPLLSSTFCCPFLVLASKGRGLFQRPPEGALLAKTPIREICKEHRLLLLCCNVLLLCCNDSWYQVQHLLLCCNVLLLCCSILSILCCSLCCSLSLYSHSQC